MARNSSCRLIAACVLALAGMAVTASAQSPDAAAWAAHVGAAYRVTNDIVYHRATGYDLKLDVYVPAQAKRPLPAACDRLPSVAHLVTVRGPEPAPEYHA